MLKKVRNLSKEDIDKLCKKHHSKYSCCNEHCPLYELELPFYTDFAGSNCYKDVNVLKEYSKILDKKVEVEK